MKPAWGKYLWEMELGEHVNLWISHVSYATIPLDPQLGEEWILHFTKVDELDASGFPEASCL